MKRYDVNITYDAFADIKNIYNYISRELQAPDNAKGQVVDPDEVTVIAVFYGASDVHSRLGERNG